MTSTIQKFGLGIVVMCAAFAAQPAIAQEAETFKLGIVTFLSGAARRAPSACPRATRPNCDRNDQCRQMPAPYNKKGFDGAADRDRDRDEAGGTTKLVHRIPEPRSSGAGVMQRRRLISSGELSRRRAGCGRVEDAHRLLRLRHAAHFRGSSYNYFSAPAHTRRWTDVAAARYLLAQNPNIKSFAGINQNYAWGQDSWSDFKASIRRSTPASRSQPSSSPSCSPANTDRDLISSRARAPTSSIRVSGAAT